MKYAIVKNGSNQLKIAEGDKIRLLGSVTKPKLEILFFSDGDNVLMDKSQLSDVKITTKSLQEGRGRKLLVGRYKAKSRYDKLRGFRTQYTEFLVSGIEYGKSDNKKEEKEKPVRKTAAKKLDKKEDGAV
jgi:large subunit ribosomal protein L21